MFLVALALARAQASDNQGLSALPAGYAPSGSELVTTPAQWASTASCFSSPQGDADAAQGGQVPASLDAAGAPPGGSDLVNVALKEPRGGGAFDLTGAGSAPAVSWAGLDRLQVNSDSPAHVAASAFGNPGDILVLHAPVMPGEAQLTAPPEESVGATPELSAVGLVLLGLAPLALAWRRAKT